MSGHLTTVQKKQQLLSLARKRQSFLTSPDARLLSGKYNNIAHYDRPELQFECDHVSPYTKCASNVDSKIMVVLQDWQEHRFFQDPKHEQDRHYAATLGRAPALKANKNLDRLVETHFHLSVADIYVTNLFPFIKFCDIPTQDYRLAAKVFCLPQIEIVAPDLVICAGLEVFNALRHLGGARQLQNLDEAVGRSSPCKLHDHHLWCQAHPSARGKWDASNVGPHWNRMAKWYESRV